MMPRGAKIDPFKTANANFLDKRSFISLSGHLYLKGDDIREQRQKVYERDKGICHGIDVEGYRCKRYVSWNTGHMDHIQGGLVGRCDCMHNLQWLCPDCHRAKHVQVQFSRRVEKEE